LEKNVESLLEKTDDLENRSRRNNLCFEGIPEQLHGHESWEKSEEKIKNLVSNKLHIDTDDLIIERAHRVGRKKPDSTKPRPIIAKFLSFKDRDAVLKARKNLKGTRQIIREDFSDRVLQKRKDLLPQMNEARNEGKIAYLSYDKLIIKQPRHGHYASGPGISGQPAFNGFLPQPVFIPGPFPSPMPVPADTAVNNDENAEE